MAREFIKQKYVLAAFDVDGTIFQEGVMNPEVGDALLGKDNNYAKVYQFVQLYEHGDWNEISRIALVGNLSIYGIAAAYHDALAWYGQMVSLSMEGEDAAIEA